MRSLQTATAAMVDRDSMSHSHHRSTRYDQDEATKNRTALVFAIVVVFFIGLILTVAGVMS